MKTIANLIWFVLSGFWLGLAYIGLGLAACVTLIGIPFGIQSIKLATFVMWPFGTELQPRDGSPLAHGLANLLWVLVAGLWLTLAHVVLGVVLCLTVIGIPFGLQNLRMAKMALRPFSYTVIPR